MLTSQAALNCWWWRLPLISIWGFFIFYCFFLGGAVSCSHVFRISSLKLNTWWAKSSSDWMLARRWCKICGETKPEPSELSCKVHLVLQKSNINRTRLHVLSQTHEWIIIIRPAFICHPLLEELQWFHIYSEHVQYVCQEDHSHSVMQMYINIHVNTWLLKIKWTCLSFYATH